MLTACACLLAACAASTPSARASIHLPPLPAKLTSCERPVLMPEVELNQAQVEGLWARDRAALVKCGVRLGDLVAFYEDLSRRLDTANLRK
ncbi:MAG: hypothetical protein EOP24_27605 [Hyphomicrobiales bacterium]|nr:MAG: hypothetical protein EOP24_27605 [Hyphomicrobiales bacterium]